MNDAQLVPLRSNLPVTTTEAARPVAGRSLLLYRSDTGAVRASLRYVRFRKMRLEFALDIGNGMHEQLLATIYASGKDSQDVPVPPHSLWIDANTEASIPLRLPWIIAFTCNVVSVRIQGPNFHQRLEAAIPRPAALGWFFSGAIIVGLIAVLVSLAQPRILKVTLPLAAIAGTRTDIGYTFSGIGTHEWEIRDLDGARVSGGALAGSHGNASVTVPNATTQAAFTLHVTTRAPWSSVSVERPLIVMTPRPALAPPRIASLSIDRAQVPDGAPVVVRYRVSAQSGDVLITDAQGTIWAQQALNATGLTQLKLPPFSRDKELQVRLLARRGGAQTSAGVGLLALARKAPPATKSAALFRQSAVQIVSERVAPGGVLRLRATAAVTDVTVSFTTQDGESLSPKIRLAGGQSSVRVPDAVKRSVVVVISYRAGSQQDAIVKTLPVSSLH